MKSTKAFAVLSSSSLLAVVLLTGCNTGGSSPTAVTGGNGDSGKSSSDVTLTVATVNNPDMKVMQEETAEFTKQTGIKVNYVVLPENDLRQKVTEDVATNAGKFDIATVGTYDTPIWAKNKWIEPLNPLFDKMSADEKAKYDLDDVLKPMRDALSYDNNLYALPFYGESSIIYYRTDLFEKAGLKMPEQPTWDDIAKFAKKLNDPAKGVTGILLRGMPGWGEILAPLDTVINTFGGQWYDQNWNAQFDKPETKKAVAFYTDLLKTAGEKGATTSGFTELETAMAQGKAAMWYDASVAAGFLNDPKQSQVVGKIGYAKAPVEVTPNGSGWLWAWSLALESSSKHKDAAFKFMTWATSKDYIKLVGDTKGWVVAPPGTRKSTYENPEYKKAAPFSDVVLSQIEKANITHPTKDPVPYTGIQYVSIPEFAQLGTNVSQDFSAVIAGQKSVDDALKDAQKQANDIAKQGGYQK